MVTPDRTLSSAIKETGDERLKTVAAVYRAKNIT